jgi:NitT/TauT family transport system ATP-binding protein
MTTGAEAPVESIGLPMPVNSVKPRDEALAVELRSLRVELGGKCVLDGIDLDVPRNEIVAVVGPSGCGKSTLLNVLSGVVPRSGGSAKVLDKEVSGLNRDVAYMTQKDTLLPWRTALENVMLPLELNGVSRRERRARAQEVLETVGVGPFAHYRPHQLSGGMRSRVSLARSLLTDAPVFLMDEPFAAIDALMRVKLQQLLLDVWGASQKTIIYVTHDLLEAIALSDRVIVLAQSRVVAVRTVAGQYPRDVVAARASSEAQTLFVDLWNVLEEEGKWR